MAGLSDGGAEQRCFAVITNAGRLDVGFEIGFELVMAGHFIDFAVLLDDGGRIHAVEQLAGLSRGNNGRRALTHGMTRPRHGMRGCSGRGFDGEEFEEASAGGLPTLSIGAGKAITG
ncbi:MAG: hypothetical protein WA324_19165 [Bryobacteraceae bacterium]